MSRLVAGGAGYIGCVRDEHLLKSGASVIVLDDRYRGNRANLDQARCLRALRRAGIRGRVDD